MILGEAAAAACAPALPAPTADCLCGRNRSRMGFTLIELLAAVAILALISLLAMPLYTGYSQRAFRSAAQADLLACALGLERWASFNFSYAGAADSDGDGLGDADVGPVAAELCRARSADEGRYQIQVNGTADGFLLTAQPLPGSPMAGDGFLTLDEAGNRGWDRNGDQAIGGDENGWDL